MTQLIIPGGPAAGSELTRAVCRVYTLASMDPLPAAWTLLPPEAAPIIDVLARGQRWRMDAIRPLRATAPCGPTSGAAVAFTGGKDSLAACLRLRASGHALHLFHVAGINPAYPGELRASAALGDKLGAPMTIARVKRVGTSPYTENPAKNIAILGMMVDALRASCGTFVLGTMADDSCADLAFGAGYSDGRELIDAAAALMSAAAPGSSMRCGLVRNDTDSILTILDAAPDLLRLVHSCMMPARFRGTLSATNRRRFRVDLLPGRCGSCYKCCSEWLHLAALGAAPQSDGFAEHCVQVLVDAMPTIYGSTTRATARDALGAFIDFDAIPAARALAR